MPTEPATVPPAIRTLEALHCSGWRSRPVKNELRDNFVRELAAAAARGESAAGSLFPDIVGYDDTVLPEVANAIIAGHDILFLDRKSVV